MTAAVFAIAGFCPLAGFFSKDAILYAAFQQGDAGKILWFVGLVTALLTSFYMFRLWYLTFFGESRSHDVTRMRALGPCLARWSFSHFSLSAAVGLACRASELSFRLHWARSSIRSSGRRQAA